MGMKDDDLKAIFSDSSFADEVTVRAADGSTRALIGMLSIFHRERKFGRSQLVSRQAKFLTVDPSARTLTEEDFIETRDGPFRVIGVQQEMDGITRVILEERLSGDET